MPAVNICSNTGDTDGMLLFVIFVLSQHNNDELTTIDQQLKARIKVKEVGM